MNTELIKAMVDALAAFASMCRSIDALAKAGTKAAEKELAR